MDAGLDDGSKVEEKKPNLYIVMRLGVQSPSTWYYLPRPYALVPSVYTSVYPSLPSSAALSLNFAPDETSSSMFLVKITVSQNDVVISPVLFLAIIMIATMSEIRVIPKAVCKTQGAKGEIKI